MRILISGHNGFLGRHLQRGLLTINHNYSIIFLTKSDFQSVNLNNKVNHNDIIFHFAGVNRDISDKVVVEKNELINKTLFNTLEKIKFSGKLFFTSSIQENLNTQYGIAKKDARINFSNQSKELGYVFHGLISPNLFGPFCKPDYNSFIATFCFNINNSKEIKIIKDNKIPLIYVNDFISKLLNSIESDNEINLNDITHKKTVSEVLLLLKKFNEIYLQKGNYPNLESHFELNLFNTFMSYIDIKSFFPKKYKVHEDIRGSFTELIRTNSKGQSSVSITQKNETRGNHYHTRKVERFSVIKGKALIKIREVLSSELIEFKLSGKTPMYIDIPIWNTHNIKNIGDEELITMFWINEHYEDKTADTFIENV
ncbi:NAD-dependent epimerase/dehydratase family protein [Flavobacteriaceae bacterium]|nr:NAD-dependent epimerase/dehydratase family protein [Flavobacteriaceae bacterium]